MYAGGLENRVVGLNCVVVGHLDCCCLDSGVVFAVADY